MSVPFHDGVDAREVQLDSRQMLTKILTSRFSDTQLISQLIFGVRSELHGVVGLKKMKNHEISSIVLLKAIPECFDFFLRSNFIVLLKKIFIAFSSRPED